MCGRLLDAKIYLHKKGRVIIFNFNMNCTGLIYNGIKPAEPLEFKILPNKIS